MEEKKIEITKIISPNHTEHIGNISKAEASQLTDKEFQGSVTKTYVFKTENEDEKPKIYEGNTNENGEPID